LCAWIWQTNDTFGLSPTGFLNEKITTRPELSPDARNFPSELNESTLIRSSGVN
jgi:hypothetical protein